ncbi:hypothetical protein D3C87_624220 [compost metagenome]
MNYTQTIVKLGVLYGRACVLYRHDSGYAWVSENGEIKNLGDISEEAAINRFNSSFNLVRR